MQCIYPFDIYTSSIVLFMKWKQNCVPLSECQWRVETSSKGSYTKKHGANPKRVEKKAIHQMHIIYRQIFRERERENLRREKMERRLSEAAMKGSVESLINLIQEDPLILDKAIASCISQSPLHLSSLLGHLDFATELLTRKPEFAAELDSEGCSPLHLAAAKGHLEAVKRLLPAGPEMGLVRNSDGRTPLHVAAIKGRVEVVAELVRVVPDSTRVVTDRGETGLHLCVRHNRLEALKFLAEVMRRERELVNRRGCEGNTILHIAVARSKVRYFLLHF